MPYLWEMLPNVDALLALSPSDLAVAALKALKERAGNGKVHVSQLLEQVNGPPGEPKKGYPQGQKDAAERCLNVTWHFLRSEKLLIPEPGSNGDIGWHALSDEAEKIIAGAPIDHYLQGSQFQKTLLHPAIRDDVWRELLRGEFDNAVMRAFRAVEESVRAAAPGAPRPQGTDLMSFAFGPAGVLRDRTAPEAEEEGLLLLFLGAMKRPRNSQAHRTVNENGRAARELVVFATYLLYLVDERRKP